VYDHISELKLLLIRQIRLNQRILKRIKRLNKKTNQGTDSVLESLNSCIENLIGLLKQEYDLLRNIGPLSIFLYNLEILFFKKEYISFFAKQRKRFMKIFEKEIEENHKFVNMVLQQNIALSGLLKQINKEKKEFNEAKNLVKVTQAKYKDLLRSIGDEKAVETQAGEILKLVRKIKKTDLYEFIIDDVTYFITKVNYIRKHPKEHKLTFVLAGVYLVAPGTFEITFAVLLVRYLAKYRMKKLKK